MELATARREEVAQRMADLHDAISELLTTLDGGGTFTEDVWRRDGGGGGVARVLAEGHTFEKAGVNRSLVDGTLSPEAARQLDPRGHGAATAFFATGVSVVVHPRSPMIPTVHLNVRYLELCGDDGEVQDAWFGGGTDLTPTYPLPVDARAFHLALRDLCDRYGPDLYPRYKATCDEYFRNRHRANEARGIGGIFFDHLRDADRFPFVMDVGHSLRATYAPLVERRRDMPYGDRERAFQLYRRGRYVEFNLLHDRGTAFGLYTNARTESVLMSLPPLAAWVYSPSYAPNSIESRLAAMLAPRDWVSALD